MPTIITIPGLVKPCVTTLTKQLLGPLPHRFHRGMHVRVTINGKSQLGTVNKGHRVPIKLTGLPCGSYPILIDVPKNRKITPDLRFWILTGGKGVQRIGFPLPQPPPALG